MELFVDSSALSAVARFLSGISTPNAKIVEVDDKVRSDSEHLFKKVSPKGDLPALKTETQSFVGLLAVAMAICPTDPLVVNGDKKEMEKWIKYVSSEMIGLSPKDAKLTSKLHKVNKDLVQTTFFLGSQPTLVDLAFFFVLHPVVQDWNEAERYQFANITRWLDYFQHFENFHNLLKLPIIKIKKDVSPALLEKAQSEKSNKQAPKTETKPDQEKTAPEKKQPAPKKDEKKESAPKKEPAKQTEAQEEKVNVSRLDIRVGKIVSVKAHEEANSLYVEQIDVGEAKPRTVVSGLRQFIPIEEMQNRFVIVLCNLKPTKLKGVLSEAMVLAASNSDHTKVELLTPLDGSKPGERLSFDGYPGEPDEQLNPKKKVWETVQPEFTTTDDCVAVYRDVPFKTTVGVIKVKSITKGVVK